MNSSTPTPEQPEADVQLALQECASIMHTLAASDVYRPEDFVNAKKLLHQLLEATRAFAAHCVKVIEDAEGSTE